MSKRTWHRVHHWVGFPLSLLLCFVLATGTLAVLSHELDWLSNKAIRASTSVPAGSLDWPALYRAALDHREGGRLSQLAAPLHDGFTVEALVINAKKQRERHYFEPETQSYTGRGQWFNWQTTLRRLHRHLMMPLTTGLTIVSSLSVLMLISLVSGLVLYRHWWRGLWTLPRRTNSRVFWHDVHRLIGLWCTWLLLIISVTGLWYLAEKYGLAAPYPANAAVVSQEAKQSVVTVSPETFDDVISTVHQARPAFIIKRIIFPIKAGDPLRIDGQDDGMLVRERANNMVFDPVYGELLSQRFANELSFHVRVSEAADPLHFGTWGGYPSKVTYFVFGVLLTVLSITGVYLYALRLLPVPRGECVSQLSMLVKGTSRMSWGGWVSAELIAFALALTCMTLLAE